MSSPVFALLAVTAGPADCATRPDASRSTSNVPRISSQCIGIAPGEVLPGLIPSKPRTL